MTAIPARDPDAVREAIRALADADGGEANGFHVIFGFDGPVKLDRPLYVWVHPGDVVQTKTDVMYSDHPEAIREYSIACQTAQASEASALTHKEWDVAVLHRFSSSYAFDGGAEWEFDDAITLINERGIVLYGDDLDTCAGYLAQELHAIERPVVVLSGAWSEEAGGCITALGRQLEELGAPVKLSRSACVSPDGNAKEWRPRHGSFSHRDSLVAGAFQVAAE